jgi:hypothetical protein
MMGNGLSTLATNLRLLALSVLAGAWDKPSLIERLEQALDYSASDAAQLATRLLFHFDGGQAPSRQKILTFLANEASLQQHFTSTDAHPPKLILDPPRMGRLPEGMIALPLPPLETRKDLAEWLGLFDHELAWFADLERRQSRVTHSRLHHYRYRWIEKRSAELRLIEIPKPRIKAIQRKILRQILNRLPPHPTAHGFCRGRSSRSYVEAHLGRPVLLRMDLKDFFHSVPVARVGALF